MIMLPYTTVHKSYIESYPGSARSATLVIAWQCSLVLPSLPKHIGLLRAGVQSNGFDRIGYQCQQFLSTHCASSLGTGIVP